MSDKIILRPYLVITDKARTWGYRVSSTYPKLESNEIVMRLQLEIPKGYFERPTLQAKISLPDVEPQTIEADAVHQVEEMIKEGLGINVNLTILNEKE